jgi:signal transduction histidine kinase
MGMSTMRERAAAAGLSLRITSVPNQGTSVTVEGSVIGSV